MQASSLAASLLLMLEDCVGPLAIYDAALADAALEELQRVYDEGK